jgi:hypothetical protein
MALTPTLTTWDHQVLGAVKTDKARRSLDVLNALDDGATGLLVANVADVTATLRGLEHLGYVTNRNGWWRRVG